ncbi:MULTISPECIES: pyrroline-5-carboxylate reductase [Brevibacillus]|uniref:pyrroline-5-carboxylate reductase n=1 Tax=Brevibacillus TaxID=55080 RepID=UPI00156AA85F|nr:MULTISPECIES: pyrroline-5-carboxylate reductase [Brevibacillus]MBU8713927.1 pyrroline-5-carboxylate reductase [Brevibacillus parabrevis]MDR4998337.1 pyrroline-5-carboxylate reductase [Brevibacillus parabrevis]MED1723057.1 pyrroline-5-carboxylate reductase [Brevibacillus parabrevis]NRQ54102.1 pyrroline-5-carboxylate reductase [Brevibacillus sp. HD1.4A]UED68281.1 pyrroline-5-carboxylate reductase [Brevibacillus sp. HD3.3A]
MSNQATAITNGRIGFLGAGSIVEAMLSGILKKGLIQAERMTVTNRNNLERLEELATAYGVSTSTDKFAVARTSDILILAIKPKDAGEALMELRGKVSPHQLIISVVAGVSTSLIGEWLGVDCPIIRTMPNTSSAVGLSATGMSANAFVQPEQLTLATRLFEAIGTVYEVAEEELDIITGLSGSGPAYIYYLVEAMMGAGATAGLDREMARQLTLQTVIGAATMLLETRAEPALLRKQVTSPGGTTQAGLAVLESYQFQEAVTAAILRATERSREMGAEYR